MEFFRKHKQIIGFFLAIFLVAWMVGLTAVVGILFNQ